MLQCLFFLYSFLLSYCSFPYLTLSFPVLSFCHSFPFLPSFQFPLYPCPSIFSSAPFPSVPSASISFCNNCYTCSFSRFRVLCFKFVTYSYTVNFILGCILISSALLAAEDPVREHSPRNEVIVDSEGFYQL